MKKLFLWCLLLLAIASRLTRPAPPVPEAREIVLALPPVSVRLAPHTSLWMYAVEALGNCSRPPYTTVRFRDYQVVVQHLQPAWVKVVQGNRLVFQASGAEDYLIGDLGPDQTGSGRPDGVIEGVRSDGTRDLFVLELGERLRPVVVWERERHPDLRDVDGDGRPELRCCDAVSDVSNVDPELIFRLTPEGARLAPDLMRARGYRGHASMEREAESSTRMPWILREAFERVYAGRADQGRWFLHRVLNDPAAESRLWEQVRAGVARSRYRSAIEAMNRGCWP